MPKPVPTFTRVGPFRVMSQRGPVVRLRNDATKRECVLAVSRNGFRVQSCRFDSPKSGGQWHAPATEKGVSYVASWVSPSAARRRFKAETEA